MRLRIQGRRLEAAPQGGFFRFIGPPRRGIMVTGKDLGRAPSVRVLPRWRNFRPVWASEF